MKQIDKGKGKKTSYASQKNQNGWKDKQRMTYKLIGQSREKFHGRIHLLTLRKEKS